ncbi:MULTISPECIES: FadR/GntR family transcriptional regulator [Halomonas]|uniref:FadR/GntR family transcriptional regulator n=1 Tax=Halomonas TaxID=2745 RepID=UPI001C97C5E3|nr:MULTISPECIES: FadR/GntR family transcriptional regulator [Halomonas]MBY5983381.1 FadR family transcriptional regulator [Halomonas sp. DP5Y7-2]MBY6206183.1 FadR family transcriptional regulator [Halomonas sp. DP3Y7-2]MBY6227926.1 FadR family transcriptional regulator [Halomonas sp. DP3Y7-1]MCA0915993.1 FadR family transcriptional regulator [Halomonas denitrificans]
MTSPPSPGSDQRRPSQYEVVVQGIQEMIVCGEITSGDRLPVESSLASRFGVSRSSLREGVRALVAMGILETRQGSGTTVTSLDPGLLLKPLEFWAGIQAGTSSRDLHGVRQALEVEAAAVAAERRTDADIASLHAVLAKAEPAIRELDHEAAMAADLEFHLTLARISRNPVLIALLEALSRPTLRMRLWQSIHLSGRLAITHQEHLAILNAVVAGDPRSAHAAMQTHLAQVAVVLHDTTHSA